MPIFGSPSPSLLPLLVAGLSAGAGGQDLGKMVRMSVLNDCLRSIVNAEKRGKRQVGFKRVKIPVSHRKVETIVGTGAFRVSVLSRREY